ncbi:AsnC family transcriptional regulator [Robbsia andropogonis]|uniref:AsnC family transcriptional regulator n=1 Tax=Robbsia andropogonis TaxID=28092 RepID=A0A0F5K2T1_9BURK|nr:Lrp/AsnC family transcriptional regulator [Robbsia andropogonis]KKB64169.1 AsnC family transcriptional regulator [Robbsia andropogonis]MCP1118707.1 Lrp/AsnC family transcriptional regulator [Robbsia andropogonis]MCP1128174.1 Lrp/AsnC family transcriptional regulator [Robbsia andropogonis]
MSLRFDELDDIDLGLLSLLQANARESAADLGRKLGVARTTVLSRITRLERHGIIAGYGVRLGKDIDVHALQAHVGIVVQAKSGRNVLKQLERMPEITLLCAVSGEFDYVAWVRAGSPERLDTLLDNIAEIEGVARTTTSIILARKIER